MEDLLSKIYDRVACHKAYSAELDREYDRLVDEKLGRFRKCMAEDDVKRISELAYELSYHVKKHGFLLGVRFMAGLLSEAMGAVGKHGE